MNVWTWTFKIWALETITMIASNQHWKFVAQCNRSGTTCHIVRSWDTINSWPNCIGDTSMNCWTFWTLINQLITTDTTITDWQPKLLVEKCNSGTYLWGAIDFHHFMNQLLLNLADRPTNNIVAIGNRMKFISCCIRVRIASRWTILCSKFSAKALEEWKTLHDLKSRNQSSFRTGSKGKSTRTGIWSSDRG